MDDRNDDLPLVVSEILIEMHALRSDTQNLQGEMREVQSSLLQVVGAINTLVGSVKTMMDENRQNTEMLILAFREEGLRSREQFAAFDQRLARIEDKLS